MGYINEINGQMCEIGATSKHKLVGEVNTVRKEKCLLTKSEVNECKDVFLREKRNYK